MKNQQPRTRRPVPPKKRQTATNPIDRRRRTNLRTVVSYACSLRGMRLESLARLARTFAMAGGTQEHIDADSLMSAARMLVRLAGKVEKGETR